MIDHYENFPVASILVPANIRPAVVNVYRFARTADDIADEGNMDAEERRKKLSEFEQELNHIDQKSYKPNDKLSKIFEPLSQTIKQHNLPIQPFKDLLAAFTQDTYVNRYANNEELLSYCNLSANPVGVIMLSLFNKYNQENLELSNAICTGLQLTNFWQDVSIDWLKNRVYLPLNAMQRHGVDESVIQSASEGSLQVSELNGWKSLMNEQTEHARSMLIKGYPLGRKIGGRFGYELRIVVQGGLRILEKIESIQYDVFNHRPVLNKYDWLRMILRAI